MHKKFRAKMKGKQAKWVATGNLQPAVAAAATAAWPEVAVGLLQMHKTYLIKTAKGAANFREAASLSAAAPLPSHSFFLLSLCCCINELHTLHIEIKVFQSESMSAAETNCTTGDNRQVIALPIHPTIHPSTSLSVCHGITYGRGQRGVQRSTVHARRMR